MAPATTPGRKQRENNYFNVGIQGRKTGNTLKDTGQRDEHGFEPVDGIPWSSPEKMTRSKRESNVTVDTSEGMEVAQSSAPEPNEVISARRAAKEVAGILPPPTSRSPMKTSIGATPRRQPSMGPKSSPVHTRTPNRVLLPPTSRLLDFSMNKPRSSVEHTSREADTSATTSATRMRRGEYELEESPGRQVMSETSAIVLDESHSMSPKMHGNNSESQVNESNEEFRAVPDEEDAMDRDADEDTNMGSLLKKSSTQRLRTSGASQSSSVTTSKSPRTHEQKRRSYSHPDVDAEAHETRLLDAPVDSSLGSKRRGRPAGKKSTDIDVPSPRASKRVRLRSDSPELSEPKKAPKRGKRHASKIPQETKALRPKQTSSEKSKVEEPFDGSHTSHGMWKVREETPMEDEGAKHTRSGRLSYKPLAKWKGERTIYEEKAAFPSVEGIIRMEEVAAARRSHGKSHQRQRRKGKRNFTIFETEEDADQEEPWELEEGVVSGPVREWDSELGMAASEERTQELAFAAAKIEIRDVAQAKFRFAKTLTMPFFGSGMVELPPRGFKRAKNSRKMQMVFFVHYGKVAVQIGDTRFVITKGGLWQVPRGNFYSINNETDHPAMIFFAQGCEMAPEPRDDLDATNVA